MSIEYYKGPNNSILKDSDLDDNSVLNCNATLVVSDVGLDVDDQLDWQLNDLVRLI